MGTRGTGTAVAPCLGSVAAGVLQRSTCPVLFAEEVGDGEGARRTAGRARRGLPAGRLLVYVDFNQEMCDLLALAGALAAEFRADLDVLYVTKSSTPRASPWWSPYRCPGGKRSRRRDDCSRLIEVLAAGGAGFRAVR